MIVAVPLERSTRRSAGSSSPSSLTGGVLILLLALVGRALIAGGSAPLARMAGTAYGMAERRRPVGPDARGRRRRSAGSATAVNLMLDRIAEAFRDRWARRTRPPLRRRRLARAAYPAVHHPRVRGAVQAGRARAPRTAQDHGQDRGGGDADGRSRRPRCWNSPAWTGARRWSRRRPTWPRWSATWPRTTRRDRPGPPIASRRRTRWSATVDEATGPPGPRQPAGQRAGAHSPGHPGHRTAARGRRSAAC